MYEGHIYNKEGLPIEGVRVSDGRNVAVSGADGYYSLPGWERESLISVQALTLGHDDWYKKIEDGVTEYDFRIDIYKGRENSTFLHISDTEIYIDGAMAEDWIGFVVECISREKPDFLIHTGDICRRKGLEEHYKALRSETAGIPVRYTLGNHDYVNEVYGEYTFECLYGPIWYSFDLGNMHYIVLPITSGEAPGRYEKSDRVRWLIEDLKHLKPGQRIGVFCHTHSDVSEELFTVMGEDISVDLREHGILFWEFGHFHVNGVNLYGDAFSIATGRPDVGGIDGTPAACRLVKIDENCKLETRMLYNKAPTRESDVPRYELGGNMCFTNPIATDDGIIVATFSDDYPSDCGIHKMSYDGEVLWKYKTDSAVKWNMAYERGRIYAVDIAGFVYCLDENGAEIFKTALPYSSRRFISGGITLCDGRLYATSFQTFYEIDANDGKLLRTKATKRAAAACTATPVIHGDRIFWGKHWDAMYALDKESLSEIWVSGDVKDSIAQPVVHGEYIFAPTRYRIVKLSMEGEVVCSSADYPECTFDTYSESLIHDGKIYVPTSNMGLAVFNTETLEELYRFDCGESMMGACTYTKRGHKATIGKPIIIGDELVFTAVDGCVYFHNIPTRVLARKVTIGHPITTGACITPKGIAIVDFDGGVSFI